jgi:cytochrome c biogenesis protein CcmG, thiol:disulfide interchange protein DsbE
LRSTPSSSAERRALLREPRTWVVVAVCMLIPVVLLIVATRGGDGDDTAPRAGCDTSATTAVTAVGLQPDRPVKQGDRAPTFRLRTLDCTTVDTARYAGKPYVLTFWGSWCVPCRKEMPLLEAAHRERGVDVVGVTYQDPASESRKFAERYDITFPLAPDAGIEVAQSFGVLNGIPQTFFVGGDGIVTERVAGIETQAALDEPLNRLLD